jgi:hypothetical protein
LARLRKKKKISFTQTKMQERKSARFVSKMAEGLLKIEREKRKKKIKVFITLRRSRGERVERVENFPAFFQFKGETGLAPKKRE